LRERYDLYPRVEVDPERLAILSASHHERGAVVQRQHGVAVTRRHFADDLTAIGVTGGWFQHYQLLSPRGLDVALR